MKLQIWPHKLVLAICIFAHCVRLAQGVYWTVSTFEQRGGKAMETGTVNILYELAHTMAAGGNYSVATALRRLVRAGYSSLTEVEGASDWALLSISGMGPRRLQAVRRLTRPDWQPPAPQALKALTSSSATS